MKKRKNAFSLSTQTTPGPRRTYSQYAAVLVFIGLAILLCISVRYGFQNDDETTCVAGAHRILFGELPLVKNWTVIQLHSFLEYLPFRIVYAINGGTEGIVLGLRYFYVAVKMLFFAAVCFVLRRYRYWAILCALIFTTFHPIDFQSLTYYNVSILCAFAAGGLLLYRGKKKNAATVAAGLAFACCVLSEPPVILLYVLFTLSVPVYALLKRRTGRDLSKAPLKPDLKTWGLFTAGAAAAACVVAAVVFSQTDLKTLLTNAPGVLRLLKIRPQTNQWGKYADYLTKTGYAANIAAAAVLAAIGAAKAATALPKARGPLFAAAGIVFLWLTFTVYCRGGKLQSVLYLTIYKPIPLTFLGLASYLLAERKRRRLFAFFLFGLAVARCMDLLSRASVFTGCVISAPAATLLFRQTLLEAFARVRAGRRAAGEKTEKRLGGLLQKTVCAVAALSLLVLTATEAAFSFHARLYPSPEVFTDDALSARAQRGPMKGLYTVPYLNGLYEDVLRDMDRLREWRPRSLFVANYMLWGNLYLDLPYATFSPDSYETDESRECLLYYWELHPDARPDAVYIPFFGCDNYKPLTEPAADLLAFMRSVCDCEVETGDAGYLLRISGWR